MKTDRHLSSLGLALLCSIALGTPAMTTTTYLGGDGTNGNFDNAAAWSNGLPSSTNSPAIISVSTSAPVTADLNAFFDGVTFNQTSGAVNYDGHQFNPNGSANTYNLYGGSLTLGRWIINGMTYNVSGGAVTGTDASNSRNHGFGNGGRLNLSGNGMIVLDELNYGGSGSLDIAPGWTGSFTIGDAANGERAKDPSAPWEAQDWETLFTSAGLGSVKGTYNGAPVAAADFYSIFRVSNNGQTLALVPEPGSLALLVPIGMMLRRRRRSRGEALRRSGRVGRLLHR